MARFIKTFIYILVVIGSTLSIIANAEIYKHVDKHGVVSYSDIKPSHASDKSVSEITPSETASNVFDSAEQSENQQASEDFFEKRQQIREEQAEKAAALTRWRKQLKAAQLELKLAKRAKSEGVIAGEGDFVGSALGGARPSSSYFRKLEKLNANVVIAEQKLATIRHQKPR